MDGLDIDGFERIYFGLLGLLTQVSNEYFDTFTRIGKLVAPIFTLLAGAYAIVQRYQYAEKRLHKRLGEYLNRREVRLEGRRAKLNEARISPVPGAPLDIGLFDGTRLQRVLNTFDVREFQQDVDENGPQIQHPGKWFKGKVDVDRHLRIVDRQLELLEKRLRLQKRHKAETHLWQGALWVGRANQWHNSGRSGRQENLKALQEFEHALKATPDDALIVELIATQKAALGRHSEALDELHNLWLTLIESDQADQRARVGRLIGEIGYHHVASDRLLSVRDIVKEAINSLTNSQRQTITEAHLQELLGLIEWKKETFTLAQSELHAAHNLYELLDQADSKSKRTGATSGDLERVQRDLLAVGARAPWSPRTLAL